MYKSSRILVDVVEYQNHCPFQEKEAIKKQLDETRSELYKKMDSSKSTEQMLREKDEEISELREEGL